MVQILTGLIIFVALITSACGANEGVLRSGKETPAPMNAENSRTAVELEIDAMRNAGFNYIFVLRRKDLGTMDVEDRGLIKENTAAANRRVSAENDRVFVIGSNPPIPQDNLAALNERFSVENFSPEPIPVVNVNSNVMK